MDPLEKIIRPIVEGQIRGFLKEHPEVLERVNWFKPRLHDPATTFTNSLAKRIVRDLVCHVTRARLQAVFLEQCAESPQTEADGIRACGPPEKDGTSLLSFSDLR